MLVISFVTQKHLYKALMTIVFPLFLSG